MVERVASIGTGYGALTRLQFAGAARGSRSSQQFLLEVDRDLGEHLEHGMWVAARTALSVRTFEVGAGTVPMAEWLALAAPGPGVLVLDGVVACEARVGERIAAELLGAGDLLAQPGREEQDELIGCEVSWRALTPARFAILDAAFADRARPWPVITHDLLARAQGRPRSLNVMRAIAAHPRLEVRLVMLFWHLASRWGRVEPGGIRLALPLTHQLLGRLIGAERPSVSHALTRLAAGGMLIGRGREWHLRGSPQEQLAAIGASAPDLGERQSAAPHRDYADVG